MRRSAPSKAMEAVSVCSILLRPPAGKATVASWTGVKSRSCEQWKARINPQSKTSVIPRSFVGAVRRERSIDEKIQFGDVLRTLRAAAGYRSQRALADAAGLPQATIAHLESGRSKRPNTETLSRIAAALGMSTDDLIACTQPVRRYVAPTPDGRAADLPTDARRIAASDPQILNSFRYEAQNDRSLFEVISDNLASFFPIKVNT